MNHPLSQTIALIVFNGSEDSVGPFEALRSEFEAKWGDLTLPDGHFWGRGVERPNRFFWIVFFKSDASLSEYFEDDRRPVFRDRILEMTSDPIIFYGLHTRPNMRELLKAPVVEVSHFRLKSPGTVSASNAQCQVVSDALIARKTKGLHGFSWALTEERGGEGVYVGGWDSIADREASIDYEDHDLIEQIEKGFDLAESIAMMNVVFQLHTTR